VVLRNITNTNIDSLNKLFFNEFLISLNIFKNNEIIMIWLSGWSSVLSFYEYIFNNYLEIAEDIRYKIKYCFLDERIVSLNDNDSNYKALKEAFLDNLIQKNLLKEENIIKIDINSKNIAKNYNNKVKSIDIWLFWVWPDGHTCSLFPNHELLNNEEWGYLEINNSPKPPKNRITVSKNFIKNIKYAFIFFIWEWKKEAYLGFLNKDLNYKQTPTKLILACENSFVVSDI